MKPPALKQNDVIGLIAPASPPSSDEKITKGIEYLEGLGYRVKLGKNIRRKRGYLAGTDEQRADDINSMFADKHVKAIFALRGGYGTPRLLHLVDYQSIRRNPKILVGYSDITALQLSIFKKTRLVTFSGPMTAVDLWKTVDPFTEEQFWRMVTSKKKLGSVPHPDGKPLNVLEKGRNTGLLLGGNLSLITSLLGTGYLPSFRNSILFLEEIGEDCYRFDRMMNQLKLSGVFHSTRGIVIGDLTGVKPTDPSRPFLTVDRILLDHLSNLNRPVLEGLAYGHIRRKVTIPLGIQAGIDSSKRKLEFLESGVR
jgi:muramoyltetrapeptide carboxypeptidase